MEDRMKYSDSGWLFQGEVR